MDKKSLLAIILSILILVVYQELVSYLYPPPPPVQHSAQSPAQPAVTTPQQSAEEKTSITETKEAPLPPPTTDVLPVRKLTVENDVYIAVFTSLGGRLQSVRLKQYPGDAGKDSPPREMIVEGT